MSVKEFNFKTRAQTLAQIKDNQLTVDALIVGGGIVGAGLARELALRGVKTLLVEKGDFASGTSSRSSKLIHGGLRYLEMLDFHLVFEALSERQWLLKQLPHLVQPLEFSLPIYDPKIGPAGTKRSWLLGLGLWLYDGLSLFRTPFFHGRCDVNETVKKYPNLRREGLKGSYYYADAMMLDDELVLENILAAYEKGAMALNYVKAKQVSARCEDGYFHVELQDCLDAESSPFLVRAKEVIVCVGPWTEQFGGSVSTGAVKKLRPSKGVHLILPWSRFPIEHCLGMSTFDKRFVFAIPRLDLGKGAEIVIVGTTDSPEHGKLEDVHATQNDVEYLLRILKDYFPTAQISKEDIIMTYSGVRPLIYEESKSEAETSREHEIWKNKAGVTFMAGGKYTTYRKISQEIAEFAFPKTKRVDKLSKMPISTPQEYQARMSGKPIWGRFTDDWVRWKLEHHAPCTLEDLVFRRMPLWMSGPAHTEVVLDQVIEIAKPYFGWSDEQCAQEKAQVEQSLNLAMRWKL